MARYPGSSQGLARNRTRNSIFVILALVLLVVLIGIVYGPGPFGKKNESAVSDQNVVDPDPGSSGPNEVGVGIEQSRVGEPAEADIQNTMAIEANIPDVTPVPRMGAVSGVAPNPEADAMISDAMALINAKPSRVIEARDKLNNVLQIPMSAEQRSLVKDQLWTLAQQWLFSRTIFPQDKFCGTYRVEAGDRLSALGKERKVPYELLMKVNRIPRPEALREGDTIKVVTGPFHAKVYRSTFTMDIYLQDTFIRSFKVGLGKDGMDTPTGRWAVKPDGKLVEPPWAHPDTGEILHAGDPEYALGSRWIGLDGLSGEAEGRTGFGIHGTKDPESIGTASSRGCVRLHNGNVIFVYDLLVPVHSIVTVED